MNDEIHAGGCLCGAVRYAVRGPVIQTTVCHCEDCRRASGAPMVAWTFFHGGALTWRRGRPRKVLFAERERWFCGDCGTPMLFVDPSLPQLTEVATCTLDEPEKQVPADQCWLADRIPWTARLDGLPRFDFTPPLPEGI